MKRKNILLLLCFTIIITGIISFVPTDVYAKSDITRVNVSKVSGTTEAVYGEKITQPIIEITSSTPSGALDYLSFGTGGYAANWYRDGEYVAPGNTFGEGNYYLQISIYLSGAGQSLYKWADDTKIIYLNGTRLSSSGVTDSRIINSLYFNLVAPNGTAPTITTTSLSNGNKGDAYSEALTVTGSEPITWSLKTGSSLPSGLSLSKTGNITGTPTVSGDFNFTVVATNSAGTAEKNLSLKIKNIQKITKINLNKVSGTTEAVYGSKIVQPVLEIVSTEPADAINYISLDDVHAANWYREGSYVAPGNNFGTGEYSLLVSINLSGTGQSKYKWSDDAPLYLNGTRMNSSASGDSYIRNDIKYNVSTTATTHTVKYISNGGSSVASEEVVHASTITKKVPTWDGHVFVGWYLDSALTKPFDFSTRIRNNIILYAKWNVALTSLNAVVSPEPKEGLTIGDLIISSSDDSKYTVSSGSWKLNDSGSVLSSTTVFEAGKTYTLYLTFYENSGYTFLDNTTYNVNGESTEWSGFEVIENRKISFTIPEHVTKIEQASASVTLPVEGNTPDFNPVSDEPDKYTVTFQYWYLHEAPYPTLDSSSIFEKGKSYSLRVYFNPKEGYEFADNVKFYINGDLTACYGLINAREYTIEVEGLPKELKVSYKTHVQSFGWQDYVSNGKMSGTEGQAKRLEGIKIKLENQPFDGDIEYRTHIQSYGWEENYKKNDEMSGTEGQAKRLEAIQIRLTGDMATYYDVYYRVHAQSFGWLGWARNGDEAGTASFAKRLEGIEIKLVPKGSLVPGYGTIEAFKYKKILYTTHVQSYGWQEYTYDGNMAGTSGEAKRLEAIKIKLNNQKYTGNVEYRTHVQSYGWENEFKKNDEVSGTSGQAKRLEAIEIKLTGEMKKHYDIYYRVHAQSYGWLNWAKNGEKAGTAGLAKRLEGIEIVLVDKGEAPPVRENKNDERSFIENK